MRRRYRSMPKPITEDSFEQKVAELASEIDQLRAKRAKLDERISQLFAEIGALTRTAKMFGFDLAPAAPMVSLATRLGRRKAILDVLLESVEPGQEITIAEMAERVRCDPDMRHLASRTPNATISTALSRAGEHFERVRAGVYRRTSRQNADDDT